jgi:hypothetical protein
VLSVGSSGLTFIVNSGHAIEVTQHDHAPVYPWPYPELEATLREPFVRTAIVHSLGTGFRLEPDQTDLDQVVQLIINTTLDLNAFHLRLPNAPLEWELALRRNFLQYQIYALPRDGRDDYHAACRLALLIYSDLVLFPMPEQGLRTRFASQLQAIIQKGEVLEHEFLVWITVMGAIAAIYTPHRDWYISMLNVSSTLHGIKEWDHLKSIVAKFLWWDPVMDPRLSYLWQEANKLTSTEPVLLNE